MTDPPRRRQGGTRLGVAALLGIGLVLTSAPLGPPHPAEAAGTYDPATGNGTVSCSGGGFATVVGFVLTAQGAGPGTDTCVGTLVVPASVTGIANNQVGFTAASKWNSGLTTITFEAGTAIEILGVNTFIGHTGLTSFTIPDTVTTLGQNVFYNTGLTCITIPASVRRIGANAFDQQGNLRLLSVYFLGDIPGPVGNFSTTGFPADPLTTTPAGTHDGAFSGVEPPAKVFVTASAAPTFVPVSGTPARWLNLELDSTTYPSLAALSAASCDAWSATVAPPSPAAELGTALCAAPVLVLAEDIDDTSGTITVGCTTVLDLGGRQVRARNVILEAGADLSIRDSVGGGELVANAAGNDNMAGIRTTGATLRIESGTVIATGGRTGGAGGAGIGGIFDLPGSGTVLISGGTITAQGDFLGAGIGGGQGGDGGTVTISGGTVTAIGGVGGAGIGGGGFGGDGGTVTISGGTVTAIGGAGGAGIGGGEFDSDAALGSRGGDGGSVTMSGGTLVATAGVDATPIGRGKGGVADGTVTVAPTAVDGTVGLVRSISFPAPSEPPSPPIASLRVACGPNEIAVGATVTCNVSGGEPGIDILWRAAYNPVIAEAGVSLDDAGVGEFSFVVPAAALGQELTVELVEWTAPVSLGVVGSPVPGSIPAGEGREGGVPAHVWSLVLVALVGVGMLRRGVRTQA